MFSDIIETLMQNGRGVHAYRAVASGALRKVRAEPQNAAAWHLFAAFAEAFLERHERMPLSTGDLEASFQKFSRHAHAFDAAAQSPARILAAMNDAAAELSADLLRTV